MRAYRAARTEHDTPAIFERRRQLRGLVWLALAALAFAVVRAVAQR